MSRNLITLALPCAALFVVGTAVSAATFFEEDFESKVSREFNGATNDDQPTTLTGTFYHDLGLSVAPSSLNAANQVGKITDDSGSNLLYRSTNDPNPSDVNSFDRLDFQGESSFYASFNFNLNNDRINGETTRVVFSGNGNANQDPLLGVGINGYWEDLNNDTVEDPEERLVSIGMATGGSWSSPYAAKFEGLTRYENHQVEIFANQHDTDILGYTGPDGQSYDLYKNTYDVWVDGVRGGGRDPNSGNVDDENYRMRGENNPNDNTEVGDSINLALGIGTVNASNPAFSIELDDILVSSLDVDTGGILGDYDDSGQVGQGDLDAVLLDWGGTTFTGNAANIPPGGGTFDGLVGQNELDGVLLNWGNTSLAAASVVPEPATLMLILFGTGAAVTLRNRRHCSKRG